MTSEPTKPKPRRWLQFSLRTFFVLVTVFCVWLGWTVHRANEQRKAVEWVREMGGDVAYGYQRDEAGIPIVDAKPPGPKWLRQLLGVDYFQEVTVVDLKTTPVSDLTPLAGLKNLELLWLNGTQVSDLTPLAKLTSLEFLSLDNTHVSDLTPLAKMTSLQWLQLNYTQVSDLTPLAGLKSLKALVLRATEVSDLTPLAKLTSLESLLLDNTPVSDPTPLAKLTNLQWLSLDNTPASEEQVEELRQALPNCEIIWSPPDPSP